MSDAKPYAMEEMRHGAIFGSPDRLLATVEALDEARAKAERLEAVLVSRHGGEPVSLLAELDEARARHVEAAQELATLREAYEATCAESARLFTELREAQAEADTLRTMGREEQSAHLRTLAEVGRLRAEVEHQRGMSEHHHSLACDYADERNEERARAEKAEAEVKALRAEADERTRWIAEACESIAKACDEIERLRAALAGEKT